MNSRQLVMAVIDALHELDIPYMVVGSNSSNYYGIPRSTQDADFLVEVKGKQVSSLAARLAPQIHIDPQMSFETVTGTWRYVAECADIPFKFEFFMVSADPHDISRFARRRVVPFMDRDAYVPAPEDVIITKLRWSRLGKRTKDADDVRNVLAVQRELDWEYLRHWCTQHGTFELLQTIQASLPEGL